MPKRKGELTAHDWIMFRGRKEDEMKIDLLVTGKRFYVGGNISTQLRGKLVVWFLKNTHIVASFVSKNHVGT